MKLIVLLLAGFGSDLPFNQEKRHPGRPENRTGQGQRPSARPRQCVGQLTDRWLLCSQTQRGEKAIALMDSLGRVMIHFSPGWSDLNLLQESDIYGSYTSHEESPGKIICPRPTEMINLLWVDGLNITFSLGVCFSCQRWLLTQQWALDWNNHQASPHRGHGCRQGEAQRRHLWWVRACCQYSVNWHVCLVVCWFFNNVACIYCATGSWCSLNRTKFVWNSSKGAPKMATVQPASAKTTVCWRCRYPHHHNAVPPPAPPVHGCSLWWVTHTKLQNSGLEYWCALFSTKVCSYLAYLDFLQSLIRFAIAPL